MYQVSEAYKEAMHERVQCFRMRGTIGDASFTDQNILAGSFSITNQCSSNDNIELGQVYIGELNATFMNVPIGRYNWKGKEIIPYFGLKLHDGTYEDIPLGVFTIDSAEWTESGVVVKAYDHMALLDTPCNRVVTEVTPYECTQIITEETGVVFATPEAEFETFANGTTMMSETTTNDVETWRDLVSWLAQACGCFATADREGNIVFRQYGTTVVDTLDDKHRFTGSSFSDFETRFTGISVVNMSDSTTSYYGVEPDDGLTMNLGSNPFLQYGVAETLEGMRREVLNALQNICYVPFKVKAIGNPAYDLGDVLVFGDGIADASKLYCITKYVFKYNGEYEMTGVGKDPALSNAKSKTDKNLIGILSNTSENALVHYRFTNTEDINMGDGTRNLVASIRFATATKESEVSLRAEILLDVTRSNHNDVNAYKLREITVSNPPEITEVQDETEALKDGFTNLNDRVTEIENILRFPEPVIVTVGYTLNGTEIDYHPVETYFIEGKHILSLYYYIGNVKANTIYTWGILLKINGGSVHIDENSVHAVIEGMGLAGTGSWDGTLNADEKFEAIEFSQLMSDFTDDAVIRPIIHTPVGFNDRFSFDFTSVLKGFTDSGMASNIVKYYVLSDSEGNPEIDETYVTIRNDDAFILKQDFVLESKSSSVDVGFLQVIDIYGKFSEIVVLNSVEIT